MANPFRQPQKREQFDKLIAAFERQDKLLFTSSGKPHRGNSFAAHFWAGYYGLSGGLFQPSSNQYRNSAAYVFYRAGIECRVN
jgi:hypothetical protein